VKRICQDVTNVTKGYWRSVAVQAVSEPENCHGAGFILRAGARVRVQVSAGFVLGVGSSKNHDELIDPTVRVSCSDYNLRIKMLTVNIFN